MSIATIHCLTFLIDIHKSYVVTFAGLSGRISPRMQIVSFLAVLIAASP